MRFAFFDAEDRPLYIREDALSAVWRVEKLRLDAGFSHDAGKPAQRGQKCAFRDEDGRWQVFEVRSVRSLLPDGEQELGMEHIALAELNDEHLPGASLLGVTAAQALRAVLSGTRWQAGAGSPGDVRDMTVETGSVWQGVRQIERAFGVYISPRVTMEPGGIADRYLDIEPAGGTWRGLRLSIDKNADEIGVTYDDTGVITAMYGYGRDSGGGPLTFENVEWEETEDHPGKPLGQAYVEDPRAA